METEPRSRLTSALALAVATSSLFPTGAPAAPVCKDAAHPITVSATNLAFGIYTSGSPLPLESNSAVQVTCSNITNILPSFTVSLSAGGAGGFNPRKLSNGHANMNYNMYTNSTYTIIWGDGTSGTSTQNYSQSQNLGQISFTDFGRVPAAQIVGQGTYTDTITVTVAF